MEKQIILFDIDGTLFDGATYIEKYLFPALEKEFGIQVSSLRTSTQNYQKTLTKNTDFDPEAWIGEMVAEYRFETEKLRSYVYNLNYFFGSIFPEVKPTLQELTQTFSLGIYSEGVIDWQNKKIDYMGIRNYFEQDLTFISRDKVSASLLENLPSGAFIIDDKMKYVVALSNYDNLHPIWLNRESETSTLPVPQIKDLTQLLGKIAAIKREVG